MLAATSVSARRALLALLLRERPPAERWAALLEGMTGAAPVASLLPPQAIAVRAAGCPCCTAGVAFRTAVARLLRNAADPDLLLIETAAQDHPAALVDQLRDAPLAARLQLESVIGIADAAPGPAAAAAPPALLAVSDLLLLYGSSAAGLDAQVSRLAAAPPFSRRVAAAGAGLPLRATAAAVAAGGDWDGAAQDGADLQRRRWPSDRVFDRAALRDALGRLRSGGALRQARAAFRTGRAWYAWCADSEGERWQETDWRRDSRIEWRAAPQQAAAIDAGLNRALVPMGVGHPIDRSEPR
ncbi:MAG TPA: GTP-binding protein [Burkholderiaceae bacterium]|nr:GTP-binding protein [Burkholderiaceae bacterium]